MDYADSYAREERKYSREKGLLEKKYIIPNDKRRGNGIPSNEPSENEKLMAEIKKYISELLELESQIEELKKILNAIKKQVEITDDETKGFYKL